MSLAQYHEVILTGTFLRLQKFKVLDKLFWLAQDTARIRGCYQTSASLLRADTSAYIRGMPGCDCRMPAHPQVCSAIRPLLPRCRPQGEENCFPRCEVKCSLQGSHSERHGSQNVPSGALSYLVCSLGEPWVVCCRSVQHVSLLVDLKVLAKTLLDRHADVLQGNSADAGRLQSHVCCS